MADSKDGFGGRSASAKAGGYNQGCQYAASGNYRGGVGSHKDLRGGNANADSGYNQGNQIAANTGGSKPGSKKDLRGGTATAGGYNQGDQK
jgi:hypothetical protein